MHTPLTTFINRLESPVIRETDVIGWGAPVPCFGDLNRAAVATLGLNPSNREFVDDNGVELQGLYRRFHTLKSLGLRSWSDAAAHHLRLILHSCQTYFLGNPYDRWFKKLDQVLGGANVSYYGPAGSACHLDLIPYATSRKWGELSFRQRSLLLSIAADSLALLLRDSPIRLLVLNGKSVVDHFQEVTSIRLERHEVQQWALHRRRGPGVAGFGYKGFVNSLCGIRLSQKILVIGYNHNIQSSFGVTKEVVMEIRGWVGRAIEDAQ